MGKADNDAFEVTSPEGVVVIEHIYGTVGLETLQSLILYKKSVERYNLSTLSSYQNISRAKQVDNSSVLG